MNFTEWCDPIDSKPSETPCLGVSCLLIPDLPQGGDPMSWCYCCFRRCLFFALLLLPFVWYRSVTFGLCDILRLPIGFMKCFISSFFFFFYTHTHIDGHIFTRLHPFTALFLFYRTHTHTPHCHSQREHESSVSTLGA